MNARRDILVGLISSSKAQVAELLQAGNPYKSVRLAVAEAREAEATLVEAQRSLDVPSRWPEGVVAAPPPPAPRVMERLPPVKDAIPAPQ
jgi:hypothetical protein